MVGRNKRNFKKFNNGRNNQPRTQNREYRHQNQLSETEVGITEYISKLDGFSGIIKARYSDFQVNEIDLDGNIAKLTDTSIPKDFVNKEEKVNYKEIINSPLDLIPQEKWNLIKNIPDSDDRVVLEAKNLTKEDRTKVHECMKSIFGQRIVINTITENDEKFMEFKKFDKNASDHRLRWPDDKPEYVHFLVYKEAIDTMEAAMKISDCVKTATANFNYAGVKDKRGKTTQWFSIRKMPPWKLITKTKTLRNIKIGNISFKDKPLKLGQLGGNKFRIALRNVTGSDELINESLQFLKDNGFINYYGLQRFGNDKEVPTFSIGINLLLGKWKEAVDLILKLKEADDPTLDITKAKKAYNETGNAKDALKHFENNRNSSIEHKLLVGLSQTNENDYVNALEKIPRNMRLLYLHAFQSLVWNRIVSERVIKFGLKPVVGDLVLITENLAENVVESNEETPEETDIEEIKCAQEVKPLTEEDVNSYSIYDVVLPLPGYDVKYPANMVESYTKILNEFGLDLNMPKQKVKTYTLSGSYRKMVSQVKDLSWKIMHYKEPTDNLIRSDFEELRGFNEPKSAEDGQYKALVIDFVLNPSSYATMVLREILKQDTSASSHAKMNNYHVESKKITLQNQSEEISYPEIETGQASLLADKEKYNAFKNILFNEPTKRKQEESEEVVVEKKLKTE